MTTSPSKVLAFLVAMIGLPAMTALAAPDGPATLWGVDEDDHELFSVGDYRKLSGGGNPKITFYGPLKYLKDGIVTDLPIDPETGGHIGSITLDENGVAYMALNFGLEIDRGVMLDAPVLLRFHTADATSGGPNVVDVIGQIPIPGFVEPSPDDDNISGLSFDPVSGNLYALWRVNNTPEADRLLIVDHNTAGLIADLGIISGLGELVEDGEDLEFDAFGNLYVTDDDDDELYRLKLNPLAIDEETDTNQRDGLALGVDPKIEGLAWDPGLGQMIGSEDLFELFYIQTLEDGNNIPLGNINGLTDVEAIDFAAPVIEQADGRLTGGGFQVEITLPSGEEVRVSRGLTIHCDIALSNNLQVNWPFNRWHITKEMLEIACTDDPAIDPAPPPAPVDTFTGHAYGSLNGEDGSILCFEFKDAGEPGVNDMARIKILPAGLHIPRSQDPCADGYATPVLDTGLVNLSGGNFQAHFDQPHK
jgi:hypothetical protein